MVYFTAHLAVVRRSNLCTHLFLPQLKIGVQERKVRWWMSIGCRALEHALKLGIEEKDRSAHKGKNMQLIRV